MVLETCGSLKKGTSLPLDLTTDAVDRFPRSLPLAQSLEADKEYLTPIHAYLMRKHDLDDEQAASAIRAYLKYLVMVMATGMKLAPSEEADQAWHAHILHTQLYEPWCNKHFSQFIHHVPSAPDQHPPKQFFIVQDEIGKTFYGARTIYTPFSASHCGANSHSCVGHGCGHCTGTG